MSQANRTSARLQQRPSPVRCAAGLVATCLVLLQLVAALHFALVPHRFGAGLRGLVHVHNASVTAVRAPQGSASRASLASAPAQCEPESCPVGFSGSHSVLLATPVSSVLLERGLVANLAPSLRRALPRGRVLLGAPKTSPPVSRRFRALVA